MFLDTCMTCMTYLLLEPVISIYVYSMNRSHKGTATTCTFKLWEHYNTYFDEDIDHLETYMFVLCKSPSSQSLISCMSIWWPPVSSYACLNLYNGKWSYVTRQIGPGYSYYTAEDGKLVWPSKLIAILLPNALSVLHIYKPIYCHSHLKTDNYQWITIHFQSLVLLTWVRSFL